MAYVHGLNSFVSSVLCWVSGLWNSMAREFIWMLFLHLFLFFLLLVLWECDAICFNVLTSFPFPSRFTSSFPPTIQLCVGTCVCLCVCVSLYFPYIIECVVDPTGEAFLMKTDFSSLSSSHFISIFLGMICLMPLSMLQIVSGGRFNRSCECFYNFCEFIYATAMLCPENRVSLSSSMASCPYNSSGSLLKWALSLVRWECGGDSPLMNEHSRVSYSLYLH